MNCTAMMAQINNYIYLYHIRLFTVNILLHILFIMCSNETGYNSAKLQIFMIGKSLNSDIAN